MSKFEGLDNPGVPTSAMRAFEAVVGAVETVSGTRFVQAVGHCASTVIDRVGTAKDNIALDLQIVGGGVDVATQAHLERAAALQAERFQATLNDK